MFGIGFGELIVIGLIVIIAVGPNRMPGMLRALVRAYREFRRATQDLRASTGIDEILQDEDLRTMRKPLHGLPPHARSSTVAKSASRPPGASEEVESESRPPEARETPEDVVAPKLEE